MPAARDRTALGLAARLVAIGGIFALAVLVQVGGSAAFSERQLTALYALVLAGFLATLGWAFAARNGSGAVLRRLELAIDGALVTGLVYCTGGARSLFSFLYLAWIVHAALRGGSRAAAGAAAGAMLGHALAVLALARAWLPWLDAPDSLAPRELYVAIGTHAVAFSLVALLAHRLARQLAHSEGQLLELSELHRHIFESVSSGLLTLDARERITAFNPEAERISGWRSADLVGRLLAEAFPEISQACEGMVQLGEGDAYARARVGMRNRAGEPLHLGLSRSTLRGAEGAPEGTVLIFQDLTRLVEIEDELSRSRRLAAVGQLATGLAHEIRNPLGAMSGAIELLAAELPELGQSGRRLARIVAARDGAPEPARGGLPRLCAPRAAAARALPAARDRRRARGAVRAERAPRGAARDRRAQGPRRSRRPRRAAPGALEPGVQRSRGQPARRRGAAARRARARRARAARGERPRRGHDARGARAAVRAVLHHEARRARGSASPPSIA